MATYYRFEIWEDGRLDMASHTLYGTFDKVCDAIDEEIRNCPEVYGVIDSETNEPEEPPCELVYCRTSNEYEFVIIRMNVK